MCVRKRKRFSEVHYYCLHFKYGIFSYKVQTVLLKVSKVHNCLFGYGRSDSVATYIKFYFLY